MHEQIKFQTFLIMKKLFLILVVFFATISANAQVYLGGTVGLSGNDDQTSYAVLPEIGYKINNRWSLGTTIGFGKGTLMTNGVGVSTDDDNTTFAVSPYVRYTFAKLKMIDFFVDGGLSYINTEDVGNYIQIGAQPGFSINISPKVSLIAKIGFVGYTRYKPDGGDATDLYTAKVNGNNISFGFYYNF